MKLMIAIVCVCDDPRRTVILHQLQVSQGKRVVSLRHTREDRMHIRVARGREALLSHGTQQRHDLGQVLEACVHFDERRVGGLIGHERVLGKELDASLRVTSQQPRRKDVEVGIEQALIEQLVVKVRHIAHVAKELLRANGVLDPLARVRLNGLRTSERAHQQLVGQLRHRHVGLLHAGEHSLGGFDIALVTARK